MERIGLQSQAVDFSNVHYGPKPLEGASPFADPNFASSLLSIEAQPLNIEGLVRTTNAVEASISHTAHHLEHAVGLVKQALPVEIKVDAGNLLKRAIPIAAIGLVGAQDNGIVDAISRNGALIAGGISLAFEVLDEFASNRKGGLFSPINVAEIATNFVAGYGAWMYFQKGYNATNTPDWIAYNLTGLVSLGYILYSKDMLPIRPTIYRYIAGRVNSSDEGSEGH